MTPDKFVFFNVVAPRRIQPGSRRVFGLGGARRWFRWQVVRHVRPLVGDSDGIVTTSFEHHSLHWTRESAWRTAAEEQRKERARRAGATS